MPIRRLAASVFLAQTILAIALFASQAHAQVPCPPCGDGYCLNHPDLPRAIAAKRARMRALGYPDRLIALLDHESPCPHCVEFSPDGFGILIDYDPNSATGRRGVRYHVTGWTRELERWARNALRRGEIRGFHIVHAIDTCNCCGQPETPREDRPGWDARLGIDLDHALSYTDPRRLGPEPEDLREPTAPELPSVPPPDDPIVQERMAHHVCITCSPLADSRNETALRVNELRRLLRRRTWEVEIVGQALDRSFAHGMRRSHSIFPDQFPDDVRTEYEARLHDLEQARERRNELRRQLNEAEGELRTRHQALLACEARPCNPAPPRAAVASSAPSGAPADASSRTPPRYLTPLFAAVLLGAGLPVLYTDPQLVFGLLASYALTPNRLGSIVFAPSVGVFGGSTTVYLPIGFAYLFPLPFAGLYVSARLSVGYVAQIFTAGSAALAYQGFLLLPEAGLRYALPWRDRRLWVGTDVVSLPFFFHANQNIAITYRLLFYAGFAF